MGRQQRAWAGSCVWAGQAVFTRETRRSLCHALAPQAMEECLGLDKQAHAAAIRLNQSRLAW